MATSGTNTYNLTETEIITEAHEIAGILGEGRTLSDADYTSARRTLNLMVKSQEFQSLHLWTNEEGVLFVQQGVSQYKLGSTAKATLSSDAVITTMRVAGAATDTTLEVTSTTGMTASDNIGIELDDGTIQWTTISSVTDSDTLVIASGLTSAAAVGRNIYTYTTAITKPLRILNVRRVEGVDTSTAQNRTDTLLAELGNDEYYSMPNKTEQGTMNSYYFEPDLGFSSLYLYQTPEDSTEYVRFSFSRLIEDFSGTSNNPDFPSEWLECLVYNLAARLCIKYGKLDRYQVLRAEGQNMLNQLAMHDSDPQSIKFKPKVR